MTDVSPSAAARPPGGPADLRAVTPDAALAAFDEAGATIDAVVAAVAPGRWTDPSPCPGWTAADVLGHLVWGQRLLAAWAQGDPPPTPADPPARELAGEDPVDTWTAARSRTRPLLTPQTLERTIPTRAFGPVRFATFLAGFPFDTLAHTWDLATATGQDVVLPQDLTAAVLAWGEANEPLLRRPGGLGPALPAPEDAPVQQRFLAFTGRSGPALPR
ncbi:TIGR03086 family protein [Geodermatophilus sp. TF02-6]|uniref:TIGR03086 family metal-binding protein n=1 Tax=Geodermatophilus sp. TF02-6 TaxID=2250575 RepID=UPI000DE8BCEB|nr:TIGR03086 family metal-binding protein [Geodermatophilus sp. TF02-6]RBY77610.1 TIGR03086 family protein [Geodermatophilus sp. TF02-6]